MAPTGVAKSSFYLFFGSKEELYLELMLGRADQVEQRVIDHALRTTDDPREALQRFLRATLDVLREDPLWRRLMTHPEEMQAVATKLSAERLERMRVNPALSLRGFLEEQRGSGVIDADPTVVMGVLQSVLLVPMFADRLADPDALPEILDLLIDVVTSGIARRRTGDG